MAKILTAYFSAGGVTAKAARLLAEAAGSDLYEIQPAVPYTKADLDWTDPKSRSSVEMKNPDSRPEIAGRVENMDSYDTLFLTFPIWWYVAPTIIQTFLEMYHLEGKTILLFATSGGSGFGRTAEVLKESVADTTVIKEGMMLNGRISEKEILSRLEKLNF